MKGFNKNKIISMNNSEDRETLDKSETKIFMSKDSRMESCDISDRTVKRGEKRKRIIYEDLLRAICKERAD